MVFSTGALLSPPDERDFLATSHVNMFESGQLPETRFINPLEVIDQIGVGSCVAHTFASIKQRQEYSERQVVHQFSTDMIYHNREADMWQGEGMYPRDALKMLQRDGVCERFLMPGNTHYRNNRKSDITQKVLDNAKYQKIDTYARVHTANELKSSILQNGPAYVTIPVGREYRNPDRNTGLVADLNTSVSEYHANKVIGWDKRGWWLQNSWGKLWGKDGICNISYNYPIVEMWTCIDKNTPPPAKEYDVEFAIADTRYKVNGTEYTMDTAPIIVESRTYVPIRFLGQALGYGVDYSLEDGSFLEHMRGRQRIMLTFGPKDVIFYVGANFIFIRENGVFKTGSVMDARPFIDANWRTMVPIRAAVEALGGAVDFQDYRIFIRRGV